LRWSIKLDGLWQLMQNTCHNSIWWMNFIFFDSIVSKIAITTQTRVVVVVAPVTDII
jgi:hypothetical protein